jgi:transcriptional regulator with XRE-family HTH domain
MSLLSDNLRYLRAQRSLSQQKLSDELIISRARLSSYEEGRSEPPLEILKRIAGYFHVSIDILVGVNVTKIPLEKLLKLEDNRILLPITVDRQGKDNIEVIPLKAKAGYLNGYGDPEFIEQLKHMYLPFLSRGKYRAFPIEGDSMPPHKNGSFIVGSYVENIENIKEGKTYVIVSQNEGIVYKRMYRKNKKGTHFLLHSDNPYYQPYEIRANDILEIWEFACSFCTTEHTVDDIGTENVQEMFRTLRLSIEEIKTQLNRK